MSFATATKSLLLCLTCLLLPRSVSAQEVLPNPAGANPSVVQQWVHGAGALHGVAVTPAHTGSEVPLQEAQVSLVGMGNVGVSTTTDRQGQFVLPTVAPGTYGLLVTSQQPAAVALYAVHVLPPVAGEAAPGVHPLRVTAAPADPQLAFSIYARYLPSGPAGGVPMVQQPAPAKGQDAQLVRQQEAVTPAPASQVQPAEVIDNTVLRRDGGMDGTLYRHGRAYAPAANTNVLVFQDGRQVGRAVTDPAGRFRIENLPAGHYALIGAGTAGLGAVGFQLVDELGSSVADNAGQTTTLVSHKTTEANGSFGLQLAPLSVALRLLRSGGGFPDGVPGGFPGPAPMGFGGGGFAGGGGGFGGGAGGGGGGLGGAGGLLGIAGLAAGAAALADSDDDFTAPPVTSPDAPVVPVLP